MKNNCNLLLNDTTISIYGINKAISVSSVMKNLLKPTMEIFLHGDGEILY